MIANKEILEAESMYQRANILNSLGYCVNNYKMEMHSGEQIIKILKQAEQFVEICLNDEETRRKQADYQRAVILKGKILNNIGACYYGVYYGITSADQALMWHRRAKEYREEHCINVSASYRVIASDYFKMSQYDKAYLIYKEFLQYSVQGKSLVEQNTFKKLADYSENNSDAVVIVLNAIGAECKWIQQDSNEDGIKQYQDLVIKEIPYQLRFCILVADRGSRKKAIDIYDKIDNKILTIQGMIECFGEKEKKEIDSIICMINNQR